MGELEELCQPKNSYLHLISSILFSYTQNNLRETENRTTEEIEPNLSHTNSENFIKQLDLAIQGDLREQEALFVRVSLVFDEPDLLDEKTFEASLIYLNMRFKTTNSNNLQFPRIHVFLALCKLLSPRPGLLLDKSALEHLNFAIKHDEPLGLVLLAYWHYSGRDRCNLNAVFALSEKANTSRCPLGIYQLALCYLKGLGCEYDPEYAVDLLQQACDLGCVEATGVLAWCYRNGKGVKQNQGKAIELYQQASDRGSATATLKLALEYFENDLPKSNQLTFQTLFKKNLRKQDVIELLGGACEHIVKRDISNADICMFANASAYTIKRFADINENIKNKAFTILSILLPKSKDFQVHYYATMFGESSHSWKDRLANIFNLNSPVVRLMQKNPDSFLKCLVEDDILSTKEKIPFLKFLLQTCSIKLSPHNHLRVREELGELEQLHDQENSYIRLLPYHLLLSFNRQNLRSGEDKTTQELEIELRQKAIEEKPKASSTSPPNPQ